MKTTHRDYSEGAGDFKRLCELTVAGRREAWQHTTWCLGRMVDWKYGLWGGKADVPNFCDRNAQLWFDGYGELAGLVIAESGDAGIAIITAPGYRFLFAELLDWALAAWAERGPRFTVELTEHQDFEARALERRGFQRGAPYVTRCFDLTRPPERGAALETGFTIVDMASHPDYRGRRILRLNAFEGKEEPGEDELRELLRLDAYGLESPIYHAATDICVMAPDGRLVAGCEALIDARNAEADLERVCSHSAFRGRGLAQAAILACMGRLHELGMHRAYITGYSDAAIGLYGSLGAVDELRCWVYTREGVGRGAWGDLRSDEGA